VGARALTFTLTNDKVTRIDVIGDPVHFRALDIGVL
jgi:hypothetical protein